MALKIKYTNTTKVHKFLFMYFYCILVLYFSDYIINEIDNIKFIVSKGRAAIMHSLSSRKPATATNTEHGKAFL